MTWPLLLGMWALLLPKHFALPKPDAMTEPKAQALQRLADKRCDQKKVFGISLSVQQGDSLWQVAAGNLGTEQPYFIASTTKLYVTAIVLQLEAEGRLRLDDTLGQYLSAELLAGLHEYQGQTYGPGLSLRQLLAHRTGLPDYFEGKGPDGHSLFAQLKAGQDRAWGFDAAIALSKTMRPKFRPGQKGKAHYADTNFQLLGRVIEQVLGQTLDAVLEARIFKPLGLRHSYLYRDPADRRPATMHYKRQPLPIPQAMASFGADGGIVSTSAESLRFLRAFFGGELFPKSALPALYDWHKVMYPLEYGVGLMRFKLPSYITGFRAMPEWLGHSGHSGAFAFYCPEKDLYVAGTLNQIAYPSLSFRLLLSISGLF